MTARGCWCAWALPVALILGLSGAAQAVERVTGGVSVQFPGPAARVELVRYDEPLPYTLWKQEAPTPTDSSRVLVFSAKEISLPWWPRWLMRQGPEAMLLQMSDSFEAAMTARYDAAGGADFSSELVHVNGHPALRVSSERRDMTRQVVLPDEQPALFTNRAYTTMLFLWDGDALVMAAVAGNQPVTEDDPFLRSVTTRTAGVPGDPKEQDEHLRRLGDIVVGTLLLLLVAGFIALVYAIDKTIKRRRARRACLSQTTPER